jgi:cell division protein FtsX
VFLLIQGERQRARATLQIYRDFGATAAFIRARYFIAATTLALFGAGFAVVLGLVASGPLTALVSIVPGQEEVSLAGVALIVWAVGGALVIALGACALALRGEGQILGRPVGTGEVESP